MLWIEKYRPVVLDEILGQPQVIRQLHSFAQTGNVPHLLFTGPHGTGKSSAVECFARELYGEKWEGNTTIIPTADLFEQGKTFLEHDERYAHLFRKDASFITNFKEIMKWYSSLRSLDADFKLMIFDDAGSLSRDAQQALRRIMERYSATCRFILCTTNQSAIIPAISSRCLPLFFGPLALNEARQKLTGILLAEGLGDTLTDDDCDLILQESRGDLRKAVTLLQVRAGADRESDLGEIAESEVSGIVSSAFNAMKEGNISVATRNFESLMIEYGLSGSELVTELRTIVKRDYNDPKISCMLADAEYRLGHANNEFVQINALVARISADLGS